MRDFNTITTPFIEILNHTLVKWNPKAQQDFEEIKKKLTQALVLAFSCFEEISDVECDASGVRIGGVLTQECCPTTNFSEKLTDPIRLFIRPYVFIKQTK